MLMAPNTNDTILDPFDAMYIPYAQQDICCLVRVLDLRGIEI